MCWRPLSPPGGGGFLPPSLAPTPVLLAGPAGATSLGHSPHPLRPPQPGAPPVRLLASPGLCWATHFQPLHSTALTGDPFHRAKPWAHCPRPPPPPADTHTAGRPVGRRGPQPPPSRSRSPGPGPLCSLLPASPNQTVWFPCASHSIPTLSVLQGREGIPQSAGREGTPGSRGRSLPGLQCGDGTARRQEQKEAEEGQASRSWEGLGAGEGAGVPCLLECLLVETSPRGFV